MNQKYNPFRDGPIPPQQQQSTGYAATPPGMKPAGFGFTPTPSFTGLGPPPTPSNAPGTTSSNSSAFPSSAQSPTDQSFPGSMSNNTASSVSGRFPPNMPNIDFSAPVIRMGTVASGESSFHQGSSAGGRGGGYEGGGGGGGRRGGLGFDGRGGGDQRGDQRSGGQQRDVGPPPLAAPTREEVARTIFIGNIPASLSGASATTGMPDEAIQQIIGAGGGLRRWTRVLDGEGRACSFGFAEYEDADSLATAEKVLEGVEVPVGKDEKKTKKEDGEEETEEENGRKVKLLVIMDAASQNYISEWRGRGSLKTPEEAQFRIDGAKEDLERILNTLAHPTKTPTADTTMTDAPAAGKTTDSATGEIVTIPLTVEDELSDIPAEMREMVAKEIASFRDRSHRKDLERLRKQEELEQAEKRNYANANAAFANGSSSATGLAGGANNIPLGPRSDRTIAGAPLGPRSQMPRDYAKGVTFVNGGPANGAAITGLDAAAEESDASDEELERRRTQRRHADLDRIYFEQERRWLARESTRNAALERERLREEKEDKLLRYRAEDAAERLRNWNDDVEAERKREEYYADRFAWLARRAHLRGAEADRDRRDREYEQRTARRERARRDREAGLLADEFLLEQAEELEHKAAARSAAAPFKLSLGNVAGQRTQQQHGGRPIKRTMAEVEGLLEDEDDAAEGKQERKPFVPLKFDELSAGAKLTEQERKRAVDSLAAEIPSDAEGLFRWKLAWEHVEDGAVLEQIRGYVEKRIVEFLGVQEELLVEMVMKFVKNRGDPRELVEKLREVLDEDAETLVRKVWRMLVFYGESEKRGLGSA